ncbi:hypothetical protein HF282_17160 [Acidithiobacillus ferrooxidans]|nr:hypothetical protein [Acidithiobacillus ferrooxidans]
MAPLRRTSVAPYCRPVTLVLAPRPVPRVSNSLDMGFCLEALQDALHRYGLPEIFNTDQGAQFTSEAFLGKLKGHGIRISMDGKGRALDNVLVKRA